VIDEERRVLLAARRALLVERAAQQRRELGAAVAPLAGTWRWVERGIVVGALLRRRPWLVAVPAALLLWWRPHGVLRAFAAAGSLWRASRSARALWLR
jgi:hypothetical protein